MMVTTKGRYALRVMVDLTDHNTGTYTPLKDIAERQGISQKYLESIMTVLSKADFVDALQGKGGGYRLNRAPEEYTVGSILKLTEGSLAPVPCLDMDGEKCENSGQCRELPMWAQLDRIINDYLEGITLGDIARNVSDGHYII